MFRGVSLATAAVRLGLSYSAAYKRIVRNGECRFRRQRHRHGKQFVYVIHEADLNQLLGTAEEAKRLIPAGWIGLTEAVELTGKSRSYLRRLAKSECVRAVLLDRLHGEAAGWWLDPADLARYQLGHQAACESSPPRPDPWAFRQLVPLGPSGLMVEAHHLVELARRRARLIELGVKVPGV